MFVLNNNFKDCERLETFIRQYRDASTFVDLFLVSYKYVSEDFLRQFKDEFKKIKNRLDYHVIEHISLKLYQEIYGRYE